MNVPVSYCDQCKQLSVIRTHGGCDSCEVTKLRAENTRLAAMAEAHWSVVLPVVLPGGVVSVVATLAINDSGLAASTGECGVCGSTRPRVPSCEDCLSEQLSDLCTGVTANERKANDFNKLWPLLVAWRRDSTVSLERVVPLANAIDEITLERGAP